MRSVFLSMVAAGLLAGYAQAQEINPPISVQERQVGTNNDQRYFLIEHKTVRKPGEQLGLVVMLPGGPGSRDFLPFCANVLTLEGIPTNYVVAELIAPQWSTNENRVIWPS